MLIIHYQLRACVNPISFWKLSLEDGSSQVHYATPPSQ